MASAGRMNKRVVFERKTHVDDGGGGGTTTWSTLTTVAAAFFPERGRERLEAGRLEAAVAGVLRIRWSNTAKDITENDRVKIDSVPYQIRAIMQPDQKRRQIEMLVERGVAS